MRNERTGGRQEGSCKWAPWGAIEGSRGMYRGSRKPACKKDVSSKESRQGGMHHCLTGSDASGWPGRGPQRKEKRKKKKN
jgi:hypothetical protein